MRSYLALAAYFLVTFAVMITPLWARGRASEMGVGWDAVGANDWLALYLVLSALGLALWGSCLGADAVPRERLLSTLRPFLVALVVVQVGLSAWMVPGGDPILRPPRPEAELMAFRLGALILALVPLSYSWPGWPWPRVRLGVFLLGWLALAIWFIGGPTSPPTTDTYTLQQDACHELLHGRNPYAAEYHNAFLGDPPTTDPQMIARAESLFGKEMLRDHKIQSFPYTPLSLLLAVPGYLLGDVRWSLLAAVVGAALLLLATVRHLGITRGSPAELVILTVLCHPLTVIIVDQAWTEPFVALLAAATLWALAVGRERGAGVAGALAATAKQFGFLLLVPFWISGRVSWRSLAWGLVVALLVVLPFVLWDPAAFWRGTVTFHTSSPFRTDCLSVPAVVGLTTGYRVSPALGFAAAAAVTGLLVWRAPRRLGPALLGSAAVLLAFIVLNKAAHINYFWLAAMLLLMGLAASIAEAPAKPEQPSIVPPG